MQVRAQLGRVQRQREGVWCGGLGVVSEINATPHLDYFGSDAFDMLCGYQ